MRWEMRSGSSVLTSLDQLKAHDQLYLDECPTPCMVYEVDAAGLGGMPSFRCIPR